MARRYMAKLAYEIEFHREGLNSRKRYVEIGEQGLNLEPGGPFVQQLYRLWMSKAYGFRLTVEESTRFLTDLDPFLYAADYVQAFYLEAMMDAYLKAHFGEIWWENKETGAFLAGLWQDANKWSGAEVAQKLGFAQYDPGLLFKYLTAGE
jgi:hypothetical protein